ncbi:MAG: transcription termination factor Rho [Puniceicoccales bacterium]|jgi:transcription termination factor Rho|nr:transcription termination factor Rho [Puniceicoccales bacterium]
MRHEYMEEILVKDCPVDNLRQFSGIVDMEPGGRYGQLIPLNANGKQRLEYPYIGKDSITRFRLKKGMELEAFVLPRVDFPNPKVVQVVSIDGLPSGKRSAMRRFEDLTIIAPNEWLNLEVEDGELSNRMIDFFCPIGKGQRGLVVAPPRTGKTTLLQNIARGIKENHRDCHLIIALVDERPEEVTDFQRSVQAELYASSNDEDRYRQIMVAELAIERAKRLVEVGKDVVILLDSITRLARAYNAIQSSGRTMSGGVDVRALERPRQLFSAARNVENGGSLTLIATALVGTGSKMDDLIFQEFKGTGNMEVVLDRKIADMRLYPAIDINSSGTRKEELLLPGEVLGKISSLRKALSGLKSDEAIDALINRMKKTKNNKEFLILLKSALDR